MDRNLILELSSDDEVGFDNSSTADNFDWITKLLEDVGGVDDDPISNGGVLSTSNSDGRVGDDDDSDDVVVVGEVIVQKPKKAKTSMPRHDDIDDDDCVILDGDPDKPKDEVKDTEEDSDDLLIVGEKGQVACRDYPHARHTCAKFPFSSTPHESRCDLCHCFVCDSLAPCALWGSGVSSIDHCHATDKEEYWKLERNRFRQLKNPPPPTPITKPCPGSLSHLPQVHQVFAGPNQLLRPTSTCGMSSTLGLPNITRSPRSSVAVRSNRFQPHLIGQHLRTRTTRVPVNRDARLIPKTRMDPSRPTFKRVGIPGRPVVAYQADCHSPNNVSVAYLRRPNEHLTGQLTENNFTNSGVSSLHSDLNPNYCPPSTSGLSPVTLPLQFQGYSQPSPHTPTSHFHGYGYSAAVASSSPYTFTSVNQTQNVPGLVRPCSTNAPNGMTLRRDQHSAVTQNFSGPTPDVQSSITQRSHQTSAAQSNCCPIFTCSTSNAPNGVVQSCLQSAEDNSLVGGVMPMHELLTSMQQDAPPLSSTEQLEFDFDNWLQDNGSIPGSQEESFVFDTNNQSPVPEPVDTGMLYFDFETSWKGLTHS